MKEINITSNLFSDNDLIKRIQFGLVEKRQQLFVERDMEVILDFGGKEQLPYGPGTYEIKGKPNVGEPIIAYAYRTSAIKDKGRFGVICKKPNVELNVIVGDFYVKIYDSDKLILLQSEYTLDDLKKIVDKEIENNLGLYNKKMTSVEITNVTKEIVKNKLSTMGIALESLSVKNCMFK